MSKGRGPSSKEHIQKSHKNTTETNKKPRRQQQRHDDTTAPVQRAVMSGAYVCTAIRSTLLPSNTQQRPTVESNSYTDCMEGVVCDTEQIGIRGTTTPAAVDIDGIALASDDVSAHRRG
eukprot:m.20550 g.20550  ORF g.20550 m.20550 type:complete len:119 (+) comp12986_c0_seq1:286-642(+)